MKNISATGYRGTVSLEPMNWDYLDITIEVFLAKAYIKAKELETYFN